MEQFKVVILAAGEGTRMKSSLPKVLHKAAGRTLVEWVAASVEGFSERPILIYGREGDLLKEAFGEDRFTYVHQEQRLGTGHAVMMARDAIMDSEYTIVLAGDMPLIRKESINRLVEAIKNDRTFSCMLLTAIPEKTPAFGRIVRDKNGDVCDIIEDRDCTEEQKKIKELNISIYCFKTKDLLEALDMLRPDNAQKED